MKITLTETCRECGGSGADYVGLNMRKVACHACGGNGFVEIGTREHATGAAGWFCGECMNSSVFRTRNIVPRDGACECCGRSDNGKVWELGGITDRPHGFQKTSEAGGT